MKSPPQIPISNLGDNTLLTIRCVSCHRCRVDNVRTLTHQARLGHLNLPQLATVLTCLVPTCRGRQEILPVTPPVSSPREKSPPLNPSTTTILILQDF